MNEEMIERMNGPLSEGSIWQGLGIKLVEATPDRMVGTMPVGPASRQQLGFLHGGASVVLAESLASVGTVLNIDQERQIAFGLEINANHVRTKRDGVVTGEATVLYRGRTNMIWDIKIRDEAAKLICISRCTVAIVDRPPSTEKPVIFSQLSSETHSQTPTK